MNGHPARYSGVSFLRSAPRTGEAEGVAAPTVAGPEVATVHPESDMEWTNLIPAVRRPTADP